MAAYRHATGHFAGRRLAVGTLAAVAALLLIFAGAERGLFTRAGAAGAGVASLTLPGITLGDGDRLPVVTSVRSDGEAERAGIRAGDEIAAVDGRAVHDVTTVRAALQDDARAGPIALHIRRGDALWTVAIDRAEPPAARVAATDAAGGEAANGP